MRWEWLELMTAGAFRNKFGWAKIHLGCTVEGKDLFLHMDSMSQYHSVSYIAPIKRERSHTRPTPEVSTLELRIASLLASSHTLSVRLWTVVIVWGASKSSNRMADLWKWHSLLFMTAIIKANWIAFLSENLNIFYSQLWKTDPDADDGVYMCRPADINIFLNLIYIYFLPLNAADTVRHSRTSDCLYANIKLWIIATSNGLLQERMQN